MNKLGLGLAAAALIATAGVASARGPMGGGMGGHAGAAHIGGMAHMGGMMGAGGVGRIGGVGHIGRIGGVGGALASGAFPGHFHRGYWRGGRWWPGYAAGLGLGYWAYPYAYGDTTTAIGDYCVTPVKDCLLYHPSVDGVPCSCRVPGGHVFGTVG